MNELARAVAVLRSGGLVAFPTETVYGLGADADNAEALRVLFRVKGRPSTHPVIVHLSSAAQLPEWARGVSRTASRLAEAFWPGPMTLILERSARVIDAVTGGAPTVGLRVPAHPLALALLREHGGGIAAPSANRFGKVSPTRPEHVAADLGADVDVILDGGECQVGVESTIIDVTADKPRILRPGGVTPEQVSEVLGVEVSVAQATAMAVPGSLPSHYAPRARVEILATSELEARVTLERSRGLRVGVIDAARVSPQLLAHNLYAELRGLDAQGADLVLVSLPELSGIGWAIADRLRKAAGPRA